MDFASLLQMMVEQNSSDLFVTAGVAPSIKTHGVVKPACEEKFNSEQAREMCYGIMNERQRTQLENTFECQFAISARGIGRFRVSTFIQRGNVGMVVRKIETHIPTLEDLQVPMVLKDISMIKRGLALMVGGTGTGKSTTLAAMVGHRNHNSTGHIITIEDPIEYIFEDKKATINQR
ncbi:MAG TPA: type IV pili twitching motility protein PilT, partial [Gammaproteobacteria bacterium]|nr:type IV pili twitching motility protein PilT [Gammaproteobacteria bacterium]MCH78815.1 type IV pili twitching motility protein PilT [Gammaproteobacteria bacterium]